MRVGPKDATNKRVETFLKHNFEATALALKAASANSIMVRATYFSAKELSASSKLSKKAKSQLKKISLATAFALDSSFDTLQLPVHAMAANMVTTYG